MRNRDDAQERLVFDTDEGEAAISAHRHAQRRKRMIMIIVGVLLTSLLIGILVLVFETGSGNSPKGDTPNNKYYASYEKTFLATVSASNIDATMKEFSQYAHIAGSPKDLETAMKTKERFESYGFTTNVEEIPVLLSYPIRRSVILTQPFFFNCTLKEAVVNDGTSGNSDVDTFNGYSPSGIAEAELVYVNYGRIEDFDALASKRKIVIARYGKIYRGNKASEAEKRGAVGVLIYIDPKDTGFVNGPAYPNGPWSTNTTVQRGSIWMGEGDPSTPGWPSTKNGLKLTMDQMKNASYTPWPLPSIPIQPISYADAEPLLRNLGVNDIPSADWQGGLNFTYKVGPGPAKVYMNIESNLTITPIWNVVATIPGSIEPDRWVILGSHRDAWTLGAGDPISSHSVLLETARVFGELAKDGWKPRRSIMLGSWDAEEYAIVGSTEFVERHYSALFQKAAVYLNLDIAVEGTDELTVSASPSFQNITQETANLVSLRGVTMSDLWDKQISLLGTGSDHVPFIHHAGISSFTMRLADKQDNKYQAVYHSNYDSYYWYTHFGDPQFLGHAAITQLYGLLAMKFAHSRVLPLDLVPYASALTSAVLEMNATTNKVNLQPLLSAASKLYAAAAALNVDMQKAKNFDTSITDEVLRGINDRLMMAERGFLCEDPTVVGKNNWFRHVVMKPQQGNNYQATAFGSLADAISAGEYESANFIAQRIALIVEGVAEYISGDLVFA